MTENNSFGSICAVVVTYNIGNGFDTCFNSLKGQVDHAVIINTSTDDGITARALARLHTSNPDFTDILECPENNLAMAQNMGIARALELGHDWVLLLDHDSRLGAGMISAMETAFQRGENRQDIGLIAPNLTDSNTAAAAHKYIRSWFAYWFERKAFDAETPMIDHILFVAASGSLIPAHVLRQEEFHMDEGLVIGHIDTDFCLRLNAARLRIMAVRDAQLLHKTGGRRQHRILSLTITSTGRSASRRYYQFRNRMKMWRRYSGSSPAFFAYDLLRAVCDLWCIILFEQDKHAKMQAVSQGVWHGLRGVSGPRPGSDITRYAHNPASGSLADTAT